MGGAPEPQSAGSSTSEMLQAFTKYLPGLMKVQNEQMGPTAAAELDVAKTTSPEYAKLQQMIFDTYGPLLANTQNNINRQNAMASATTDTEVMKGPGTDLVKQALELSKIADPEYYATREQLGGGLASLIGGQDPNQMTEAEMANAERGANRVNLGRGTEGTGSPTEAIRNAGVFGEALDTKRANFGNALSLATGSLGPMKSGVDVFQQATGKSGMANNAADTKFTGVQGPSQTSTNASQGFLGQLGQLQGQYAQNQFDRETSFDQAVKAMGAIPSVS